MKPILETHNLNIGFIRASWYALSAPTEQANPLCFELSLLRNGRLRAR